MLSTRSAWCELGGSRGIRQGGLTWSIPWWLCLERFEDANQKYRCVRDIAGFEPRIILQLIRSTLSLWLGTECPADYGTHSSECGLDQRTHYPDTSTSR
jgi:hypothetical protein